MARFPRPPDAASRNAVLFGAVLLLLGLVLLGFTEHADRLRAMGVDALGGFVLSGDAAKPGPASDGKLVLVAGAPEIREPARDAQFGVSIAAPALVRKVEMYQWIETRPGGRPAYQMNWLDRPVDSTHFAKPAGHMNPGAFPIAGARFDAGDVRVGGFRLAPGLVAMIQGMEAFRPDFSRLPANMAASFQAHDGALLTSSNPARPQVGDLRVSWLRVAPDALTVFARDQAGTLVPAQNPAGVPIAQVLIGRHGLTDVLTDAPQPPHFKWARRILAVLLAWAGVAWLLPRARHRDRVLSLALAAVPLAVLAAICWWGVRNPAAGVLVLVAVAGAGIAAWRWRAGLAPG